MNEIDNSLSMISKIRSKANEIIINKLESNGIKGLVPSHGDILVSLYFAGKLSKSEISDKIKKGRSTVTKLLAKLAELDFIEITDNFQDKRASFVSLSSKGHEVIPIIFQISKELNIIEYNNFSELEREMFFKLLKKVFQNFQEY